MNFFLLLVLMLLLAYKLVHAIRSLTANLGWINIDRLNLVDLDRTRGEALKSLLLWTRLLVVLILWFREHPCVYLLPTILCIYFLASDGANWCFRRMLIAFTLFPRSRLRVLLRFYDFNGSRILDTRIQIRNGYDLFGFWVISHHLMHVFLPIRRRKVIFLTWAPSTIRRRTPRVVVATKLSIISVG